MSERRKPFRAKAWTVIYPEDEAVSRIDLFETRAAAQRELDEGWFVDKIGAVLIPVSVREIARPKRKRPKSSPTPSDR